MPRPLIVCVEGLIGAGKSSLLQSIVSTEKLKVAIEPVHEFRCLDGYNPLSIMYSNKKEVITVQAYINCILRNYWTEQLDACFPEQILVSEKSLYSTRIFSDNLKGMGVLSDFQYHFLNYQMQQSIDSLALPEYGADKLFFLDVPVETCFQRMIARGRLGEELHCDYEYLSGLDKRMKEFLENFRRNKGDGNVKVVQTTDIDVLKTELMDFVYNNRKGQAKLFKK